MFAHTIGASVTPLEYTLEGGNFLTNGKGICVTTNITRYSYNDGISDTVRSELLANTLGIIHTMINAFVTVQSKVAIWCSLWKPFQRYSFQVIFWLFYMYSFSAGKLLKAAVCSCIDFGSTPHVDLYISWVSEKHIVVGKYNVNDVAFKDMYDTIERNVKFLETHVRNV